jgi:[acyl-carrier-protein] S-malonyltransferase
MKIACIFPGFGSQYVGMAKEVYDNQRVVQEYFEEAYNCLDTNFVKLCFASSDEEISTLENSYLGLFLANSSLFALLKESGISPDWVAGYGMGAYSALYSAGAFTFPDGLYLIKKLDSFYKEYLENNPLKAVCITNLERQELEEFVIHSNCEISTYRSIDTHYVLGEPKDVESLKKALAKSSAKVKDAAIENCLNSQRFTEVADSFKIYLEKVDFKNLKLPYCSSFNRDISSGETIKKEVVTQISMPNKWASVMKRLKNFDLIIEVGPGTVLKDLVSAHYPELNVVSFNKSSDIEKIKTLVGINAGDTDGSAAE